MNAVSRAEVTQLAQTSAGSGADGAAGSGQYLTFTLDDELFAVGIAAVREIIQYGQMTLVPLMPDFVRGVINLRGAVVPVIDLQARLGRAPAQVGERSSIVIFEVRRDGERHELGMMVDAVSEVIEIADAGVDAPPQFGSVVRRDYIHGIVKVGGRFVVILALGATLDIDDMAEQCDHARHKLAA
jgi:purine-binding chemotaxis protein CheW